MAGRVENRNICNLACKWFHQCIGRYACTHISNQTVHFKQVQFTVHQLQLNKVEENNNGINPPRSNNRTWLAPQKLSDVILQLFLSFLSKVTITLTSHIIVFELYIKCNHTVYIYFWLLSVNIKFMRFIHTYVYLQLIHSLLYSILLYKYDIFTHSTALFVIGHLGCFQFLANMNSAAMMTYTQVYVLSFSRQSKFPKVMA